MSSTTPPDPVGREPGPSVTPSSAPESSPPPPLHLLRILTHTSNASALVFTTFLGTHLAAPVVGLIAAGLPGGEVGSMVDSASRVMLLGRAYYHSLELPIVYLSAGIHILAGAAKRIVLMRSRMAARKRRRQEAAQESTAAVAPSSSSSVSSTKATSSERDTPVSVSVRHGLTSRISHASLLVRRAISHIFPLSSAGTWSAYALLPFFVHHTLLNRIIPSSSATDIGGLSPAELDYGFVAHGLSLAGTTTSTTTTKSMGFGGQGRGGGSSRWGWINWISYVGLVSFAMAHVVYAGARLVRWARWYVLPRFKSSSGKGGARRQAIDDDGSRLAAIQKDEETRAILTSRESQATSTTDAGGLTLDARPQPRRKWDPRPTLWITSTTILLACLVRLDHEGRQAAKLGMVSRRLLERYEAVYRRLPWPY